MRILLTGACGRLGKHVRAMAGDEHEFVCMDVDQEVEGLGGICANVTDRDAVFEAARDCDAVMHTAALHAGFPDEPFSAFAQVNIIGTENVLAAATERGVKRVIFSSTLEIMVGRHVAPRFGTAVIDENMPVLPDWNYSITKAQAEEVCRMYARNGDVESVILRYGDFCHPDDVTKIGLGLLTIAHTPGDAAQANLLALQTPNLRNEVFHIGPGTPLKQRDVNEALIDPWPVLERYWPGSSDVLRSKEKALENLRTWRGVIRTDKAALMLGYKPVSRFETYLESLGWQQPGHAATPLATART